MPRLGGRTKIIRDGKYEWESPKSFTINQGRLRVYGQGTFLYTLKQP